jgi:hypothetical protein
VSERPLLFLDVDGPLIPFGAAGGYPSFPADPTGNPLVERIDPALGPRRPQPGEKRAAEG